MPLISVLMNDSYLFDASWLFFAAWSLVLAVVSVTAFGRDLIPAQTRMEPGESPQAKAGLPGEPHRN